MGLRGAGAKKSNRAASFKPPAWKRKRGRAARVISFLESLPITKGILAGTKMKLLPGQLSSWRPFTAALLQTVAARSALRSRASHAVEARPAWSPA